MDARGAAGRREDLVLVGGGHAHVQVLKSFAMRPPPGLRLTVVVDTPLAVYSGMVPGFVAGQYALEELEIDVVPLARLAGARVVLAAATGIDAGDRLIRVENRAPLRYDVASFDIGSTVAGLDVPGVRTHAIPTRPIGEFARTVDARLAGSSGDPGSPVRAAVVGGGAGGIELAFTLRERLESGGGRAEVTLFEAGPEILAGYDGALRDRVAIEAEARGIRLVTGAAVESVAADHVVVGGDQVAADIVVWVAGAAPHDEMHAGDLPTDDAGFIRVGPTLQVEGFENVFASGDCASLAEAPWVPKAGVYAVRQGRVLTENLRRAVAGHGGLDSYRPQRDFLTLLNLGDGTALGTKWGRVVGGRRVFRLKDWIDRRFVRRFQVLDAQSSVSSEFETMASMRANMDVQCGGCAAKLGQGPLERALGRLDASDLIGSIEIGIDHGDDAAAYAAPGGTRVVSSVDQFRAFTDDPYLVGRVGAINAASDVFAKGVSPTVAQAIIALPESLDPEDGEELLFQVLAGARHALDDMDIALVGGHTTTAPELLVGFHVEGFAGPADRLLAIDRLPAGRTLILTKGLGTGVIFHADMKARARGEWVESAIATMLRSNGEAAGVAREMGAEAATDVTGFGLARHLSAMLRASDVAAVIDVGSLPLLAGAARLFDAGLRSTFHDENAGAARGMTFAAAAADHPNVPALFDPQTSGGLLFGVDPSRAEAALAALRAAGCDDASAIGSTAPFDGERLTITATA